MVLAFPDKPWNWHSLSENPNITIEHVLANPDKPWRWGSLSRNPNITMKHVLANPDKPWDWYYLSENPNITLEDVLANPNKPWRRDGLSTNPNLRVEHISSNLDKGWSWEEISRNKFSKHPHLLKRLPKVTKEQRITKVSYLYLLYTENDGNETRLGFTRNLGKVAHFYLNFESGDQGTVPKFEVMVDLDDTNAMNMMSDIENKFQNHVVFNEPLSEKDLMDIAELHRGCDECQRKAQQFKECM